MFLKPDNTNYTVKKRIKVEDTYAALKITAARRESGEYTPLIAGLTLHNGAKEEKIDSKPVFHIISTPDLVDGKNEPLLKFVIKDSKILISKEKSKKNRDPNKFLQFINLQIETNNAVKVFEELEPKTFDLSNTFLAELLTSVIKSFDDANEMANFEVHFVADCYINDLSKSDEEIARSSVVFICPLTHEVCYDSSDIIMVRVANQTRWNTKEEHSNIREALGIKESLGEYTFFHKSAAEKFKFRSACIKKVEERASLIV